MKKKIRFRQLLEPHGYSTPILLEVLNWMLRTGQDYTARCGWYEYGVDKQIFGYSANNHPSHTSIEIDQLRIYFLNAVFSSPQHKVIEDWRKSERINLDSYRMLDFSTSEWNIASDWHFIKSMKGAKMKKEFYHPDYPDRIDPYVITIPKISTRGNGYSISYDFTFPKYPDSAWSAGVSQFEGEPISEFLNRSVSYFKERLIKQPA